MNLLDISAFVIENNIVFLWGFIFLIIGIFFGYVLGLYNYVIRHWGEVKQVSEEVQERGNKK